MKKRNAAGRKTDMMRFTQGRTETYLGEQLGMMTEAMRTAFARADAATPQTDEYGHLRSAEVGNAVRMAKTSAKIMLALAKLSGEFNHNITVVHRDGTEEPPRPLTPQELEELDDDEITAMPPPPLEILRFECPNPSNASAPARRSLVCPPMRRG